MTPNQTLVPFPEFANSGTKVAPEAAKYAEGYIPSEVLPAEHLNYFFNRSSAGQTAVNQGLASVEKELNNVLDQAQITPALATDNQVLTALKLFFKNERKDVTVTTAASVQPAATGVGLIESLYDGLRVSLVLKNGYYGSADNGMTFNVNGLGAKKVFVPRNGQIIDFSGHTIDRSDGNGSQNWYAQAYTKFELEYDSTLNEGAGGWIITNNPIVLSSNTDSSGYTVYADGRIEQGFTGNSSWNTATYTRILQGWDFQVPLNENKIINSYVSMHTVVNAVFYKFLQANKIAMWFDVKDEPAIQWSFYVEGY